MNEDVRFPIGKYQYPGLSTADDRERYIRAIHDTPMHLRQAVNGLKEEQLNTPYREGGWTVRQVVHHLPDSHLNAYVRFKLALTESEPMIKPYQEALWAELPDSANTPVETSLTLLAALHDRWVRLLKSMSPEDFMRRFNHPEYGEPRALDWLLALYAWHGPHHVAHITGLRQRMGWH